MDLLDELKWMRRRYQSVYDSYTTDRDSTRRNVWGRVIEDLTALINEAEKQ